MNVFSREAEEIFKMIDNEGVEVFHKQPGFLSYRLMRAGSDLTIAVAEWESEELGKVGAENYRKWLRESGIWDNLVLQTYDGEIVASS
jgi:heme-degrading monooxygenase HmoA